MHSISEIKTKISEIARSRSDLNGVAYGRKISNGKEINELCIVYFVDKKKPLSELSESEVIPSTITLTSGQIKTDVCEGGKVYKLACNAYCGEAAGLNSAANRSIQRPLRGGVSLTSKNNVSSVGTMGFIAVHSETQSLVGITNNHVTIQDAFYTADRNLNNLVQNEYSPADPVYQHGETGGIPPANYTIGQSLRYVPIYLYDNTAATLNYADCAMFSLTALDSSGATVVGSDSYKQIGQESYTAPYPFATTAEIDNLLTTNPMLYSSGRTTGTKGGSGCPMRTKYIHWSSIIGYDLQGGNANGICAFDDLIVFVKPETDPDTTVICYSPIRPGDSGSALIADFGGVRKIIGLVFAGAGDNYGTLRGYACRIDKVAAALGIEAWDGTPKNYINPASIEFKTVLGKNYNKTLTCNGKTYWQVGLTYTNNPC